MSTQEVANKLIAYCRMGQYSEAQEALYDENAASIEPEGSPNPSVSGMDALKQKAEQWAGMVEEVHGGEISDPIVAGDFFSITQKMDITFKGAPRQTIEQVCVYGVKDGKIVLEQFFYTPPPQ